MSLEFSEIFFADSSSYRLPMNYLPSGLNAVLNPRELGSMIVVPTQAVEPEQRSIPIKRVGPSVLSQPELLNQEITQESDLFSNTLLNTGSDRVGAVPIISLAPPLEDFRNRRATIVIDLGIAFWNQRFAYKKRHNTFAPRFREVLFIDDDLNAHVLNAHRIETLFDLGQQPNGDAKVVERLAADFEDSFYATPPNGPDMTVMWHGTAMTDLASKTARPEDDEAILGIELPRGVLLDPHGDTLKTTLLTALKHAAVWVGQLSNVDEIKIVLGFGFPGGPQTPERPDVEAIINQMRLFPQNMNIELVLPAGNHLQDRCFARLEPGGDDVTWRIPPDDGSANSIDIGYKGENPEIGLTTPDGRQGSIRPRKGSVWNIMLDGRLIGRLSSDPRSMGGNYSIRLSLAPTAPAQSGQHAPSGDWKVWVGVETDVPRMWILRDDNLRELGVPGEMRRSVFHDPNYRERDADGAWYLNDSYSADVKVLRHGTYSLLALAEGEGNRVAATDAEELRNGTKHHAYYSGLKEDGTGSKYQVSVDDYAEAPGLKVIGNGSNRMYRFSGTSAAAGKAAD